MAEPVPLDDAIATARQHRHAGLDEPPSLVRRAALRPLWSTFAEQLRFNEDVVGALEAVRNAATHDRELRASLEATCRDLTLRSRALHEQLLSGFARIESSLVDIDLELAELRTSVAALEAATRH